MKIRSLTISAILIFSFLPSATAHPSWGLRVDHQGNIYFADIFHQGRGSLCRLTPDGQLAVLLKDFHAHNINLDAQGNPVSAHGEGNHTMVRLHRDGTLDTLFHTENFEEFFGGNAAYLPTGEILFQIDHHLWVIDGQGNKSKYNDHYLKWSQSTYVDKKGVVYVPEIGDGQGKVYQLDRNGEAKLLADHLITKTAKRPYDKHNDVLLGIAQGCDGHIYVCETAGRRIVKIEKTGKTSTFYRPDDGWTPCAVDFFQGDAYIQEYHLEKAARGPRIVKISEVGEKRILFDYESYWAKARQSPQKKDEHKGLWIFVALGMLILGLGLLKKGSETFLNFACH